MCGGRGTRLAGDSVPNNTPSDDTSTDDDPTQPTPTNVDPAGDPTEGEKPLVEVCGTPMVERVLAALRDSRVERMHLITSPHTPDTRAHLASLLDENAGRGEAGDDDDDVSDAGHPDRFGSRATIVDTPGEGYVPDLRYALDRVRPPVLTVACDLPLLAPVVVNRVLDRAETCPTSLAVCVPAALKRLLGTSTDSTWERGDRELAPTGLNVVAGKDATTPEADHEGNQDRDRDHSTTTTTTDTEASAVVGDERTDADGDRRTSTDTVHVSYDARLAVNVNRPTDLAVAEALCE
jgi:adenosylcobinamide-phosphate guanylyltransferase